MAAWRFFGGQSCNFRDLHLGQNAALASWVLREPRCRGVRLNLSSGMCTVSSLYVIIPDLEGGADRGRQALPVAKHVCANG